MQDFIYVFHASQFHLPFLFSCQKFHLPCTVVSKNQYSTKKNIRIINPRITSLYTRFLKLPLINLCGVNSLSMIELL